eukprot:6479655-Amphidinium_carterae.1
MSVLVRLHICQSTAVGRAFKRDLEHIPEEQLCETWFGQRHFITDGSGQVRLLEQVGHLSLPLQSFRAPRVPQQGLIQWRDTTSQSPGQATFRDSDEVGAWC